MAKKSARLSSISHLTGSSYSAYYWRKFTLFYGRDIKSFCFWLSETDLVAKNIIQQNGSKMGEQVREPNIYAWGEIITVSRTSVLKFNQSVLKTMTIECNQFHSSRKTFSSYIVIGTPKKESNNLKLSIFLRNTEMFRRTAFFNGFTAKK